jgi:Fe2+ or Zn2+ uptake regulation protein
LATIYSTLGRFAEVGLLKRIVVGPGKVFFDTDTRHDHHVYYEESNQLRPVPARQDGRSTGARPDFAGARLPSPIDGPARLGYTIF